MKRVTVLVVTSIAILVSPATKANAYHLLGVGGRSCGGWTADRQMFAVSPGPAFADKSWVQGFLSGIGFTGFENTDPLNGMDSEGLFGWIDNFCQANPIKNIAEATATFFIAHPD